MKIKIQNKYHKRLGFNIDGKPFGIEKNEIKVVEEDLGKKLLKTHWIEEVKEIKEIPRMEEIPRIPRAEEIPKILIPEDKILKIERKKYKGREKLKTKY